MKKLLILIVAVAVCISAFLYWREKNGNSASQPTYQAVKVESGDIRVKVLSTGTIEPYTRVVVSSSVSGRIDKVEVDEGDLVRPGDILAWISSEDRIGLLDAARSALESAQEKNDEEALEDAKRAYEIADKAYKPVPLTNSIAGEVINRSCEPGQNVSMQSALFVIADRLVARVQVDEADIGRIRLKQDTWVVLDAFPDERVQARVTKISREGTLVSDVVEYDVMVEPLDVPVHWASGMTANVEFIVDRKDSVLVIPRSAVFQRDDREFAMVLKEKPEPRQIETGITDGRVVEVVRGLKEGDTVVLSGAEGESGPRIDRSRAMRMMMRRR
ncbi:MAG: efflux RND transporter periplasmic adaptor subunit [Candidatus Eiseniibacteriota bacterium]|nr:MAG: efflux RND transporter periplasmic adaptor subunit [Candidatus Eisenbacteria bacterium]